jgi:hypothetical protein
LSSREGELGAFEVVEARVEIAVPCLDLGPPEAGDDAEHERLVKKAETDGVKPTFDA